MCQKESNLILFYDTILIGDKMNILLYGSEQFLIDQEIKKILGKNKVDNISVTKYDLTENSLKPIIEDCSTISLFDDKKAIIVSNASIFNRGKSDDNIDMLEAYLANPNPNSILILINSNTTVDNTKKITKIMKEHGTIKEFNNNNIFDTVKTLCDGYKMDRDAIQMLIDRVGPNLAIIETELNKLKIYKIDDKKITVDDVVELASISIDTDIFKFIDHIISRNKDTAMTIYEEMMKQGEEPVKIIALLASKFRLMYQATELTRSGYSQQDISSTLGVHIYPVKLAINAGLKYESNLMLHYMKELSELDIKIKTGKVNPILGLELFILDI